MTSDLFDNLVEALISVLGGLYAWMVGVRKAGKPPGLDARYDDWHDRFGKSLRVLGPLIMLFGFGKLVVAMVVRSR